MTLGNFLKLVEIQTKLASMIPFLLGTLFSIYRYKSFRPINFVIMFISLLTFDMATTAINNYYDYKKAIDSHESEYKKKSNIIGSANLNLFHVKVIIALLITIAVTFGVILTIKTNIVVLLIGVLSFTVGVLYTFGPIPLSRMPLGEIFSGFFMGFIIMFLAIYIHIFDENIVKLMVESSMLTVQINIKEVLYIFILSIPAIGGISNIMLANNICDLDEDIINKRFTLPYYLGKKNAVQLYKIVYYVGFLAIISMVLLGIAPLINLLVLLTFFQVNKNIDKFYEKQLKSETFVLAVKNFVLMNAPQIILLIIVNIFNYFVK